MKKTIARVLIVAVLLTMVTVPTVEDRSSEAASGVPEAEWNGVKDLEQLSEENIIQQVGKTTTVTVKNVKKSNVKSLTVLPGDGGVVSVTKKKLNQKKVGFKLKFKKAGRTNIIVNLVLKKKQAGLNSYWIYLNVIGVNKLSQNQINTLIDNHFKANTHSNLLEKHGSYHFHINAYYADGEMMSKNDDYQFRDDMYVRKEVYYLDGTIIDHQYLKGDTGYENHINEDSFSGYFIDVEGLSEFYKSFPISDEPEDQEKNKKGLNIVCAYSDGERIYIKEVSSSEPGRTDIGIDDAKSYELIQNCIYLKDSEGKTYLAEQHNLECGIDAPDMYTELKTQYSRTAKDTMKIECVIDPGKDNERRISMEIPQHSSVDFLKLDGYGRYADPEGKTNLKDAEWDSKSDLIAYYIKNEE